MDLLKEITEEYSSEVIPLMEAISQAVKQLQMQTRGGKVTNKMIADFVKKNPKLTTAAALNSTAEARKSFKLSNEETAHLIYELVENYIFIPFQREGKKISI